MPAPTEATLPSGERALAGPPSGGVASLRGRLANYAPVAGLVAAGLLVLVLGQYSSASQVQLLDDIVVLSLFAAGTNLLLGSAGILSFGQAVFFGAGAYTVSLAWLHYGLPFGIRMVLGPVVAVLLALPIGLVVLRTQRWYLALATLGFSQLAFTVVEEAYGFTNGEMGVFGAMVPDWLVEPLDALTFIVAVAVVALTLLWVISRSPFALLLRAAREDRASAEALGLNVYRQQLIAFVVAAAFCGVAGCLFVVANQATYPTIFNWLESGNPILAGVIGGTGNFAGPILGSVVLEYGKNQVPQYTSHWQLILGLILLLIVMVRPSGLAGLFEDAASWARHRVAARQSGGGR